jgi:hypothetical protein
VILLNFSHPISDDQHDRIQTLTGQALDRVIEVPTQFDHDHPFPAQVTELVDGVGLTAREWQTEPVLILPPALNSIAVALLAELHGRAGYFVPVVRTRPVEGSLPPRYEVAEVINLQAVRDEARKRRQRGKGANIK